MVDLSETCRVLYQINMRNSASRWLSLYHDAWSSEWQTYQFVEADSLACSE